MLVLWVLGHTSHVHTSHHSGSTHVHLPFIMAVDYEYTPPSSPFRKALHTCMFLILGATWSVALVQFGERKASTS